MCGNDSFMDAEELDILEFEDQLEESSDFTYIKMDYSLETPDDRIRKVQEIIDKTPPSRLTARYLDKLSDYILDASNKQEKKEKKILTENRLITVNKRETSFEGLAGKLENGEDGLYNMIANDKNIIFSHKVSITEQDIEEIPGMKELKESIKNLEERVKMASGRKAYLLKKQAIEMRQLQYILKNAYRKPIRNTHIIKSIANLDLSEKITIQEDGSVISNGKVTLLNDKHVSLLLCNYSKLKEESWDKFNNDIKWALFDLENLIENYIKNKYPLYYDLIIYKIDGLQNTEIQSLLEEAYGIKHSVEYISSLWRNKIPKLIAEAELDEWLVWHYTFEERGQWKKCTKCGQIKLAHNRFFSYNKTSKDKFYSICKACRNKKK